MLRPFVKFLVLRNTRKRGKFRQEIKNLKRRKRKKKGERIHTEKKQIKDQKRGKFRHEREKFEKTDYKQDMYRKETKTGKCGRDCGEKTDLEEE